jgi:hypothetical protein
MGVAIAIGIHSLYVDDAARGDAAAGHVGRAARRAKLRRGWGRGRRGRRLLRARCRGLFRIVSASAHKCSRESQCSEQPLHSSPVTTRVPAGRLRSPSTGVKRIA